MTPAVLLRADHLRYLAERGAMSPMERWLFGLGGNPHEADAGSQSSDLAARR